MALIRLAEVLGRLSLAFDIANDYPHGKAVRSTVLAVELGKRAGATDEELRDTYWPVADIATAAHERLDGSGYPQHHKAQSLSLPARLLAAADMAFAMTEDRPHRPALRSEAIARELLAEVTAGRLDARAVDAVLATLGLPNRAEPTATYGLSERELEVSRLLARGKSNKEIGADLHISPRTVQIHVARTFDKWACGAAPALRSG